MTIERLPQAICTRPDACARKNHVPGHWQSDLSGERPCPARRLSVAAACASNVPLFACVGSMGSEIGKILARLQICVVRISIELRENACSWPIFAMLVRAEILIGR
jgi:hypothetical protein